MAIIKQKSEAKKEKLKIQLSEETFKMINEYCSWSKIDDISYFIEEAANFVFKKDKEWKKYLEEMETSSN
ncbi:hypothetical protein OQJ18_06770 [Fluoribacter dumoffii]|uniref:Uncharacterized protein n=1 Tax=Fluoribacter dumoffii TaxID=463 RepID=A0A377G914_9GAMM|nr:hypothetical protein [Fluoribacter dumoffii]KTC89854.1 hypothetical protein Ldum_0922 [Fluoribacter dumoffii NY 23]MCW8385150.1 hypothetical protein [Fluoribacter dumoffii]MCW8418206.1 hypothetical protein [Fluoribacter dumoffii]MCW8453952.1 hypothetical protein [Fluoribacter dumoffii]MCW8461977.1 hypothetical protein [Fluoribacter dumoffii]